MEEGATERVFRSYTPGVTLTTIHFLCNLISYSVFPCNPFQPSKMKHSILLGPLVNSEENEML
jgi:hypothetical protein